MLKTIKGDGVKKKNIIVDTFLMYSDLYYALFKIFFWKISFVLINTQIIYIFIHLA